MKDKNIDNSNTKKQHAIEYKTLNKTDRNYLNNAIVRIISVNTEFDWLNPYRVSNSSESVGTGFFISDNGLLITCFHVVEDSIKLYINIPDKGKKRYNAKIICVCPKLDLALLQVINYKPEQIVKLGDSDKVRPGDNVKAMGYPLGQEHIKYTAGIISGRQNGLIQTDTPINPGNSGGPLLNEINQVIGINSSGVAAFAADNIGFAVPSYNISVLIGDISKKKNNKLVKTPFFGCKFVNCNTDCLLKEKINKLDNGILVSNIVDNTPISNSGLKNGDILLSFHNIDIDNYGECKVQWSSEKEYISDILKRYVIYDKIPIKYYSIKNKKIINSVIDFNKYTQFNIGKVFPKFENIEHEIFAGMIFMDLCKNHLSIYENSNVLHLTKYHLSKNQREQRLIVSNIFKGSFVSKLENIIPGDLVISINDKNINTLEEFRNLISSLNIDSYITIIFESGNIVCLSMKSIISESKFLTEEYSFELNKIVKKFL